MSCTICGSHSHEPHECCASLVLPKTKEVKEKSDPVNNPSHYKLFPGQEAIDIIRAALTDEEFAGYCKGNALKYRLRAGEKGDTQQDIDKSNWYRKRLITQSGHKVT